MCVESSLRGNIRKAVRAARWKRGWSWTGKQLQQSLSWSHRRALKLEWSYRDIPNWGKLIGSLYPWTDQSLDAGLPWWLRWLRICLQGRRPRFDPWIRKIPWRREWLPTPVFLPGEFHGQRSLAGYSPWGPKESDTTKWLTLLLIPGKVCSLGQSSCFLPRAISRQRFS